jgi:hypothetical protein
LDEEKWCPYPIVRIEENSFGSVSV